MNRFIELLERKIDGCDALGGLAREKAVYQSILKEYRKQLIIPDVSQQRELLKFWLKYSDDDLGMTEEQEDEYINKCIENFNCG